MSIIKISDCTSQAVTVISNIFIDHYMAGANGEFVKVYLYLIRMTAAPGASIDLAHIADTLNCTERDVIRALNYWAGEGLMQLGYDDNQKLAQLRLIEPTAASAAASLEASAAIDRKASSVISKGTAKADTYIPPKKAVTAGRRTQLKEDEDFSQFLYIAEQYLGRPLTTTDINNYIYFYDSLHMNAELLEYLIEYCVSKGHTSARYIEQTALGWHRDGIQTADQAKEAASLFQKDYFTILKSLGIKNRAPIEEEIVYMKRWLQQYGFTMDIIKEACARTVLQTGQASFQYADKILSLWKEKQVKHLQDIQVLDEAHQKKSSARKEPRERASKKTNAFNNYPHREYDFDEIKKSLFQQ